MPVASSQSTNTVIVAFGQHILMKETWTDRRGEQIREVESESGSLTGTIPKSSKLKFASRRPFSSLNGTLNSYLQLIFDHHCTCRLS